MELTENKSYRFNVIRIEEAKGNLYYVINVNNKEVWVKLFDYQRISAKLKKQIDCVFCGFDKYGSYIFVQDKLSILNDLYEENQEYKFKFVSESLDNNTNVGYSIIRDEYGISHRLYDTLSENQKCGKEEIICIVDSIDPVKKILRLKLKKTQEKDKETDFSGTWFDADRVFSDIHREDMKKTFFDSLLSSEGKNPYLVSMKQNYLSKNNLWIFSLLNYIDNVVIKKLSSQGNHIDLELYTELVIDLQKWILEDSDFLEFFSGERKEEAKRKSETQLIKYDAQLKAINLIKENKQEEFIEDILSSLRKSKRIVWRRNDRIQILLRLLSLDANILQHDIDSFIELVMLLSEGEDLLDEFNRNVLNNVLSWRISTENAQLNQIMHYESEANVLAKKQTIINIIRVVGSQVILAKYDENISRIKRSQFFRYVCLISEKENRELFLNLSIDSLLGMRGDEDLFKWDIVLNFNINEIIEKSRKITPTLSHDDIKMYSSKGNIYNYGGKLVIVPNSLIDVSQPFSVKNIKILHGILDGRVLIGSCYTIKDLVSDGNILEIYKSWDLIIKGRSINGLCKEEIEIGDTVRVMIKKQNQNDNLKSLLFVSIISGKNKIESCIHVTHISSKYISDVRNLFTEGDIIDARVLKIKKNGNIELTLRPFTDKFSNTKTAVEEDLKSLVIGNVNDYKSEFKPITKDLLAEFIYILDMYIKIEGDIVNKFFYIMYNRLLTGMLRINSKTSYYTFILYYNIALYEFIQSVNGITTIKYQKWYDIICNKYPELENKRIILKLIESINELALIEEDELYSLVNGDDVYISKIARLVLALRCLNCIDGTGEAFVSVKNVLNNVLSEQNEFINIDIDEVRKNSLDLLKNDGIADESEEDNIIESYGYENQTTEFKTSYIYYAGNSEVGIQEQSDVIMKVICGFLNADGGKVLIGVDDNGLPVGILKDLKYLNENIDEYERRIRKNIVDSFSKDINGLISIKFDKNNVCIITVPSYHKPVSLYKNFWQRQGNETRMITGEDLIPFILRRSSVKENKLSHIELKNNYEYSTFVFDGQHIENQINNGTKTLAFWNLFKDGSYIVMDTKIVSKDILQTIPLTNEMKKGYILQCYNNGCINKYPMRNILDKKKGFKYINGLYAYSSIKMISIISDDLYLIVKSECNDERYIKIYNSSNISLHTSLHLKGNQVVDNAGDNARYSISYYILPNNLVNKLKKLIYNSPAGIGRNIDNVYYLEEKNILIKLGVI